MKTPLPTPYTELFIVSCLFTIVPSIVLFVDIIL